MDTSSLDTSKLCERRFLAADGLTLIGDEAGDVANPCVILMHGGGQTRNSWSRAAEVLAQRGYHVINFDARGHGASDWSPTADYSLATRAGDLRAILRGIDAPIALIGASMGGATALQAIGEGLRPAAVVLVDITLRPDGKGVQRIFDFMSANPDGFPTLEAAADAIATYYPERPRPRSLEGLRKNLREDASGRYRWHWDPRILSNAGRNMDDLEQLVHGAAWRLQVDALLVRGEASDVVTDQSVEHMRDLIPRLQQVEVRGAGHMVAGDRNDAFNRAVLEFLDRVMPAGTPPVRPPAA